VLPPKIVNDYILLKQVVAGDYHGCVTSKEEITCWGDTESNQINFGLFRLSWGDNFRNKVNGTPKVTQPEDDQDINGYTNSIEEDEFSLSSVEYLSAGAEHNCGLFKTVKNKHSIVCWGLNNK